MKVLFIDKVINGMESIFFDCIRFGLLIDVVHCLNQGVLALKTTSYDAVVYISKQPDQYFIQIKKWRKEGVSIPILVLTEFSDVNTRIDTLNAGSDDYLSFPVQPNELVARIRAIQRRSRPLSTTELSYGDVIFDIVSREVTNKGEPVKLTAREMTILELLLLHNTRLLTRQYLENYICTWQKDIKSNVIEVHISNLRRKLGRNFIETVHGQGYRLKKQSH